MRNLQQKEYFFKKKPGSKLTGRGHICYILAGARNLDGLFHLPVGFSGGS
jgi:hypothetical protein